MSTDATSPVSILVVDDVEQNLLAMRALLSAPGLRVLTANSGAAALELLLSEDVALALIDVQMPEMDGFALAELMRGTERTRRIPIIFATAAAEDRTRTFRGYDAGAVDFLYKPFEPMILKSKVAVFVDLWTQAQQLRMRMAELERAIKLNELMTAVLSHDLRTPLSAVLLSAELVQRNGEPESIRRAGQRIRSSTIRMTRMIDQLLDFSRIRAGVIELARKPAMLDALCATVVSEVREGAPGALIEVEAQGDMSCVVDADRLMQVFSNLLANAIQHGSEGRPVTVRLDGTRDDTLGIVIANAGAIPPDVQAQLFVPFRTNPSRESRGLGLGLYIVDQFVRAHGGTVRCTSDEASGTRFDIALPRGV